MTRDALRRVGVSDPSFTAGGLGGRILRISITMVLNGLIVWGLFFCFPVRATTRPINRYRLGIDTNDPEGVRTARWLRAVLSRKIPWLDLDIVRFDRGTAKSLDFVISPWNFLEVKPKHTAPAGPWGIVLVLSVLPVQVVAGPEVPGTGFNQMVGRRVYIPEGDRASEQTSRELLNLLEIRPVELQPKPVYQDELHRGELGFFMARVPTPAVAYLLSHAGYRLIPIEGSEMVRLHDVVEAYASVLIPAGTYPRQPRQVYTVGVPWVLAARMEVDSAVVETVTRILLRDLTRSSKSKGREPSFFHVSTVLHQTRRMSRQQHPGAALAFKGQAFRVGLREYLDWVEWTAGILMALLLATLSIRRVRLDVLRLLFRFLPNKVARPVRAMLFDIVLWRSLFTLALLILVWQLGALWMYSFEHDVNPNFMSLRSSSLSMLVYLFSGLEDRMPVTTGGWLGSVMMLLMGLLLGAYITGQFASFLVQRTVEVFRMTKNIARDSLLVIGWNPRAQRVLDEFFRAFEADIPERAITVFVFHGQESLPTDPYEAKGVTFVKGLPFDKTAFRKVGAQKARSILVLADRRAEDPDAQTLMTVLAIRSLCRESDLPIPHICAEVVNHRKMDLIRDAGAVDIVCHEDYGLGVLAQSAFAHDITQVYHDLLTYAKDTCEIYVLKSGPAETQPDIPADLWDRLFEGCAFEDAAERFNRMRQQDNPMILLGLRRANRLMLNPVDPVRLQRGDCLVILAWVRPSIRHMRRLDRDRP